MKKKIIFNLLLLNVIKHVSAQGPGGPPPPPGVPVDGNLWWLILVALFFIVLFVRFTKVRTGKA